jgi:hypothetical protein
MTHFLRYGRRERIYEDEWGAGFYSSSLFITLGLIPLVNLDGGDRSAREIKEKAVKSFGEERDYYFLKARHHENAYVVMMMDDS